MTNYVEIGVTLTPTQHKQIAQAVQNNASARLRFTNHQLISHNAKVHVTPTQFKRMNKAKDSGKGIMITLTKKQLQYHKTGGFLPMLLGSLAASALPWLLNKVFPDKQEGSGINRPKSRKEVQMMRNDAEGINLPGYGINIPGYGIRMPGNYNYNQSSIRPANGEQMQYHLTGGTIPKYRSLNQKNLTRGRGITDMYLDPQSERFQMLK